MKILEIRNARIWKTNFCYASFFKAETTTWNKVRQKVCQRCAKKAKSNFVNKAFYIFEFNLKFCKGIQKFKANKTGNAEILNNPGAKIL